jgi:predicted RNase H-like nuclease
VRVRPRRRGGAGHLSGRERVAGLDGTKGGWVAITLEAGRFHSDHVLPIETTFEELGGVDVIAIDVPIGFGPREADDAARTLLRGRASTVFTTPARALLEGEFGPGLGISAQAHALGPRILRITRLAETDERIHEVHPEVSFQAMNDGRPLLYRKKSAGGALERIALLGRHGIELAGLTVAAAAPLDDVVDAAAAAWSARRIARGQAVSLPNPPELVEGRPVAIWY